MWRSPLQHMVLVKPVLQFGFQFGTCTSRKMWSNQRDNKEVWGEWSRTTKHIHKETLTKLELFSLKREVKVTVFQTCPIKVVAKTMRITCSLCLLLTEQKVVNLNCSSGEIWHKENFANWQQPLQCLALFRALFRSPSCWLLLFRLSVPLTTGYSACCSPWALQTLPTSEGVVRIVLSLTMIDCFNLFLTLHLSENTLTQSCPETIQLDNFFIIQVSLLRQYSK